MRNVFVDISRGILIFYIITIIHGVYWLNILPRSYGSVLLFEMPLIFIVSGYSFALFKNNKGFSLNTKNYFNYLVVRSSRLLLPFFVYSIVCAVIVILNNNTKIQPFYVFAVAIDWLNPLTYGRSHSLGMLRGHLWFIYPFLVVSGLLPFAASIHSRFKPPLWLVISVVCGITFYANDSLVSKAIVTPLFYLFWAYWGFIMEGDFRIKRKQNLFIISSGVILLIVCKFIFSVSLDMQINKFPPNILFFIFSFVWVSFIFLIISYINLDKFKFLADSIWLKPFIISGYSIYLWQGFGYTAANTIRSEINISIYLTWIIAIVISVIMGIALGPLEKIKIRLIKS